MVKEEEQPWLRGHGFLHPSQLALWPDTSVWDFLRVLHDSFRQRWTSGGEALPILDDVRHALGSPDHISRDSVRRVVGYSPDLCHLHQSLVKDMRLDIGGTDDVDHAIGWFDVGSGQGCPLSPLDYAAMGEVRARMVSKAYPGVHSLAGLLHSLAWANNTVWLARGAHRVVWGTRGQHWSIHDSKGYIDGAQSRNLGSSPLFDDLLCACQGLLAVRFDVPQHLYSHRVGTFVDSLLDTAGDVAKRQAAKAQPGVG